MPDEKKTVTLTIDGVSVTVPAGTLLVEAAKRVDNEIPVYCYHPKLGPAGLCRICLVEIEKLPKLQIACNTAVADGMVVHTASEKAHEGRRAVLEFLLVNHPLDCPICDKGGECDLQDFSIAYGQSASRTVEAKAVKPKAIDLGPTIVLDGERCIVCQRCSRFDEIITNEQSLVVKDRGQRDIIATATGEPYVSNFSGNVTELCPVGALTSKTYRFKSRPWDLHRTETTCLQCSVGCAINVDERHGEVLRTMSVPDDVVSDGWLCDRGRYNVGFYADARRIHSPLLRDGDDWNQIGWDDAIALWAKSLKEHAPGGAGAIGGGRLLNEEAFLLQHIYRKLGVRNLDWRAGRQREATPGGLQGRLADLEAAQTIVVIGVPPSQTAPVLDLRIRKAVMHHGARLFSVGPQRTGSFVPETHVAHIAELPAEALTADRIAVVYDGIARELLAEAVAVFRPLRERGKQLNGFIAGEQPNARGAEAVGMLPRDGGLGTRAMLEAARDGKLASLAILGANPLLRFTDRALVEAALANVPFLVVSELFMTETALRARLVLPARGPFEKSGSTTNVGGAVREVWAGLTPPAGTLSDGEMLVALAAELNVSIPAPAEIATRVRDLINAPFSGDPAPEFRVHAAATPAGDGLVLAIAEHIFGGGGTALHDDRLSELWPQPQLRISPATARKIGAQAGDLADAGSPDRGLRDLVVAVDDRIDDDTVVVVAGLPAAPANGLIAGERVMVTNLRAGADPVLASGAGR
ncbi:MAG: molybdopterin-dependent oxidoreductase [Vulcanimicrobiaceae bacterium]